MPDKYQTLALLEKQRSILARTERALERTDFKQSIFVALLNSLLYEREMKRMHRPGRKSAAYKKLRAGVLQELAQIYSCWPKFSGRTEHPIELWCEPQVPRWAQANWTHQSYFMEYKSEEVRLWEECGGCKAYTDARRELWAFIKLCVPETEYE